MWTTLWRLVLLLPCPVFRFSSKSGRKAYFSAFLPIEKSPFAEQPAEDPTRALRLYQSDFMLRDYGFGYDELPFYEQGLLPRDRTPKQAWAERNLHEPIEVNRA